MNVCWTDIEADGLKIPQAAKTAIEKNYKRMQHKSNATGRSMDDLIAEGLDEFAKKAETVKMAARKNQALNFRAYTRAKDYIDTNWADYPEEGLATLMTGVQNNRPGAKDSISVLQQGLSNEYKGAVYSKLMEPMADGTIPMDYIKSELTGRNPHEKDVHHALHILNQAEPDTAAMGRLNPGAVAAARVIKRAQDVARIDANNAGANIGKLDGYAMRRSHDAAKIEKVEYDEWRGDYDEWLDIDKTDIDPEDLDQVLRESYNQFRAGEHMHKEKPESTGMAGMGNVGKSMSHERVFHFKSEDAEYKHFVKYGRGHLLEAVVFDLEVAAQKTGLMRKLGPNARMNWDKLTTHYGAPTKGQTAKRIGEFNKTIKSVEKNKWPLVDGSVFIAHNNTVAKVGQWYRAIKMMAVLGKAVITAITDIPIYASEVRNTGGSRLGGMFEAFNGVINGTSEEQGRILAGLGVISDNMRGATMSRFDADNIMPGAHTKATQLYFRMNLLGPWTDRLRTTFALTRANELAGLSRRGFKTLPEDWQRVLSQFNIDDAKWEVIRKGKQKGADGKNYLTPEGVADIDDAAIGKYLEQTGQEITDANIRQARREIQDNYRAYFTSRAYTAALEPDAGTRSFMLQGTQAGSVEGEILRAIGMLKSFPLAIIRQVLNRDIAGASPNVYKGFTAPFKMMRDNPSGAEHMVALMIYTTIMGYTSLRIKEMVDGKKPRMEMGPKELTAAFLQGGAAGIYGDLLFGEMKNRYGGGALSTLAGPAGQDVNTVADLYYRATRGEDAVPKLMKTALRNVPGNNFFYSKAVYDYMIVYQLMELTNPGSLKRMEDRMQRETGQTYMHPPSETGGGMPNF